MSDTFGLIALAKANANSAQISQLSDYVTVAGSGTGDNTYACDVGGEKSKNFAFTIADTDAKIVTLSNLPTGRCEVMLEITTTAVGSVTWTLNGGTVTWSGGLAPTIAANKTYNILLIKKAGATAIRAFASLGV